MQRIGGPVILIVIFVLLAAVGGGLYFVFGVDASGTEIRPLTANANVVAHKALKLSVEPANVPQDFKVGLNSITPDDFAKSAAEPFKTAREKLPGYLSVVSPVYTVATQGTAPARFTLSFNLSNSMGKGETLDLYAWDGASWAFVPSRRNGDRLVAVMGAWPKAIAVFQTAATVQVTSATLDIGETLTDTGSALNIVAVSGPVLQADGSLLGGLAGGVSTDQGYAVMPLARTPDDGGAALNAMLADSNARLLQIGGLVDLAGSGDYKGIVIDYRGLDPARAAAFNQFVLDAAGALHQKGKTLTVAVPTPVLDNGQYTLGGYDLRTLGAAADVIQIPLGADLPSVGNGGAARMITWAVGEVNRYKLRLLLSALSSDAADSGARRVPAGEVLQQFGTAALQTDLATVTMGSPVSVGLSGSVTALDYDSASFAPRFTYQDFNGVAHTVLYVTPETLAHQLALAQSYHLGGVSVNNLFDAGNPAGMFDALVQYKVNNAALAQSATGATLNFVVSGAGGVVAQATAVPGQPFVWTAGQPGQYSIAANLQSAGGASLGSVDVLVPDLPTATPTVTPTATRIPSPPVPPCSGPWATTPPPATHAPTTGTVNISGGGAWGPFALGGQAVHGGVPHSADMKHAGMSWVKIQGHYGDDLSAAINNAHSLGFKILLSVVGDRGSVMNPSYQQQFASYMAGLASQGADALEVWNEPNIDREWPTGQVSGANYASLLKVVYPAIKGANNGTIVISAAPAPTGYFGGDTCGNANGCDDRPFLTEFVAAGGGNYLDCIGAHYNEGIVSPTEIGTDPRDNYFTRYYSTMLTTYSGIFAAARPICFTELGYLTGEGYPDLATTAPSFAWAANTGIAEQALWLSQAASLAKGNSNVRLMIVFNIDFTAYGSDPQAGYAIIRADGSCPACDSLASVMP